MTEAQVPLADGVGGEARVLAELRHDLDVGGQTAGHQRLDVHVLPPHPVLDTRAVSPRRLIDMILKFLKFNIHGKSQLRLSFRVQERTIVAAFSTPLYFKGKMQWTVSKCTYIKIERESVPAVFTCRGTCRS